MGNNNVKALPAPPANKGDEVLAQLLKENGEFVRGRMNKLKNVKQRRDVLSNGQAPVAAVIACADSRVSPEILFRAGLGELFVIRTAGNCTWGPEIEGSLQYAVEHLEVPLVIVLGHSKCGAVGAAVSGGDPLPGQLGLMLTKIAKGIEMTGGLVCTSAVAIERNVRYCVSHLTKDPNSLLAKAEKDGLKVVGAVYDIRSGRVDVVDREESFVCKTAGSPTQEGESKMVELEPEQKVPVSSTTTPTVVPELVSVAV